MLKQIMWFITSSELGMIIQTMAVSLSLLMKKVNGLKNILLWQHFFTEAMYVEGRTYFEAARVVTMHIILKFQAANKTLLTGSWSILLGITPLLLVLSNTAYTVRHSSYRIEWSPQTIELLQESVKKKGCGPDCYTNAYQISRNNHQCCVFCLGKGLAHYYLHGEYVWAHIKYLCSTAICKYGFKIFRAQNDKLLFDPKMEFWRCPWRSFNRAKMKSFSTALDDP